MAVNLEVNKEIQLNKIVRSMYPAVSTYGYHFIRTTINSTNKGLK